MREKILKSRYLIPFCYSFFFIFAFLLFFYLTLPVESLKQRIMREIEMRTPFRADITRSISVSPVFSLKIQGLKLYKAEKPVLNIDELSLSPSLISTIVSDGLKISFKARLLQGETEGTLVYNSKTKHIEKAEARLAGVNIETIPAVAFPDSDKQSPSVQGLLGGSFSFEFNPQAKGEFAFEIKRLGIKNLKISGLLLPEFSNIESTFSGKIENEITRIEELKFTGDGLDLMLSGTAPLLWEIRKGGKIDLGLQLRLTGTKLAMFKSFLVSYLAPLNDGSLGGKIGGTIHNPRLVKGAGDSQF